MIMLFAVAFLRTKVGRLWGLKKSGWKSSARLGRSRAYDLEDFWAKHSKKAWPKLSRPCRASVAPETGGERFLLPDASFDKFYFIFGAMVRYHQVWFFLAIELCDLSEAKPCAGRR
jgi:hypothetical protein